MKSFNEVVKEIEKSEKNVDKVLKAARLKRHEKCVSNERLEIILGYLLGLAAMIIFLIIMVSFFYFAR